MNVINNLANKLRQANRARIQRRRWRRQGGTAVSQYVDVPGYASFFRYVHPRAIKLNTTLLSGRKPRVSVVISAYGKSEYTLRCLASLKASEPSCDYEVLVIEDASGDEDALRVSEVAGVEFIANEVNLGYLRSNNKACALARGEFVLLLNNDTEVLPGAIDALVALADRKPRAGLIGAKLLYPDGRLQEAGGILWSDGSAWNFGRLQRPMQPQFNYVRQTDYCSAACILVRKTLWDELKGFDEHYLPAYCEDSDLAMRVREAGFEVWFQPAALVIHFEGVSHGTDTQGDGVKRHQIENQIKLRERWCDVLEAENFPGGKNVFRAKERGRNRKILLVVDHYLPEPDRDAGSRSMFDFLGSMARSDYLVKFWPANQNYTTQYAESLEQLGIEIIHSPEGIYFSAWIDQHGSDISVAFVSRPEVAQAFLPDIRRHSNARVIFYGHDLHHERMRSQALLSGAVQTSAEIEQVKQMEMDVWRRSDVVLYPSSAEADQVKQLLPRTDARRLTPYAMAPEELPKVARTGRGVLFVAGFRHPPNEDAASWLVEEVMPIVWAKEPQAMLVLAGSNPTDRVKALAGTRVTVTGSLNDEALLAEYKRARVATVPLRYGAGVKCKTVEAMAAGLALVSTPVGVQGLERLPSELAVTDDASLFAEAILRLLGDDKVWLQAVCTQLNYVGDTFNERVMTEDLLSAIEDKQKTGGRSPRRALSRSEQLTASSVTPVAPATASTD